MAPTGIHHTFTKYINISITNQEGQVYTSTQMVTMLGISQEESIIKLTQLNLNLNCLFELRLATI